MSSQRRLRVVWCTALTVLAGASACDCGGTTTLPTTRDGSTGLDAALVDGAATDGANLDAARSDLFGHDLVGLDLGSEDALGTDAAGSDAAGTDGAGSDAWGADAMASDDAGLPGLHLTGLLPGAGYRGTDVDVVISGTGLRPGAVAVFTHQTRGSEAGGTATFSNGRVNANGTALVVTFPALAPATDRPAGPYDVTVTNPAGSPAPAEAAAPMPYVVTVLPPPMVEAVTPTSAYAGNRNDTLLSDRAVAILGSQFVAVPDVSWLDINNPNRRFHAADVRFVSASQLIAVVPSESQAMAPGNYHLLVENPDGQGAYWLRSLTVSEDGGSFTRQQRGLFEITTVPPPSIDAIDPARPRSGQLTAPGTLQVSGKQFATAGATVEILIPTIGGEPTPCLVPALASPPEPDAPTLLWRDLAAATTACSLGTGLIAAVRVTNPDGQFATYFALQVTANSEGKLSAFCDFAEFDRAVCPGSGTTLELAEGRARHDTAVGFDDLATAYLYAAGGEGSGGGYLDSIDAAPVSPFGQPGLFALLRQTSPLSGDRAQNRLYTARQNLQLVRVQNFLYALGGTVDVAGTPTPTASVERARILGLESIPGFVGATGEAGGGQLPAGAFYYRLSAVTDEGEGLPSRERLARPGADGRVQLQFERYPGAHFYRVYRSLAVDGPAQSSRLLGVAEEPTSGTLGHFVDDGVGPLAPAPGHLSATGSDAGGSLAVGLYGYRVAAQVPDGQGGQLWTAPGYLSVAEVVAGQSAVELRWDAVAGATAYRLFRTVDAARSDAYLLVVGATVTATQLIDTGFSLAMGTAASDRDLPLTRGSLTWFAALPQQLTVAREGARALALDVPVSNPPAGEPPWRTFIFVIGGRADRSGSGTYLASSERAEVSLFAGNGQAAGDLLGFALERTDPANGSSTPVELGTARAFFALITSAGSHADQAPPTIVDRCAVPDRDGDGFRSVDCGGTDCNDQDPRSNPGAKEICGDGLDQDCSGDDLSCTAGDCASDPDRDGDGHARLECSGDDCDDTNPDVFPGAPEVCGDDVDQDCSGADLACAFDAGGLPGDGGLVQPDASALLDANRGDTTKPMADASRPDTAGQDGTIVIRTDGGTFNCRLSYLRDQDQDGYVSLQCGGTDCNDRSAGINPGVVESPWPGAGQCDNGVDEDCDGSDMSCIQGFTAPPSSSLTLMENDEPVFVAVLFGSKAQAAGGEQFVVDQGSEHQLESSFVSSDGHLLGWTFNDKPNGTYSAGYGLDALCYFNFIYPAMGVNDTGPVGGQIDRYMVCPPGAPANEPSCAPEPSNYDVESHLVAKKESTSVHFNQDRAFFSLERVYSRVFGVGGYTSFTAASGTGTVTASVEQAQQ